MSRIIHSLSRKVQPLGIHVQPYTRIGGIDTHMMSPLFYAKVQTDGSFYPNTGMSRVAMILTTSDRNSELKHMKTISTCEDSTETEWASVSQGLLFALENNERIIALENDNLGVVSSLIMRGNSVSKKEYAKYYRYIILGLTAKTEWTGIRWIPREMNLADGLFRANKGAVAKKLA
jgi:ribonuclease HI